MKFKVSLVLAFAMLFGCIYIMTLGGCATASVPRYLDRGELMGGMCQLPAQEDEGWVQTFCEESPDLSKIGCGYVGWLDDKLCLAILETTTCADDDWKLVARWCGDEIKMLYSLPERE